MVDRIGGSARWVPMKSRDIVVGMGSARRVDLRRSLPTENDRGKERWGDRGRGWYRVHQTKSRTLEESGVGLFLKGSAATYSRASYTCTTIGNAVFDGRVRDGIGSGHRFMATVNF